MLAVRSSNRALVMVVAAVAIAFATNACGGSKTTTTTNAQGQTVITCQIPLAKTKFLLHAGVAAGAFYRYVYDPWRAGAFKKTSPGRKKALAKAGASALVAVHELRVAAKDARCDGPALRKLASPISSTLDAITSLKTILAGSGAFGGIATAAAAFDELKTAAAGAGAAIKTR